MLVGHLGHWIRVDLLVCLLGLLGQSLCSLGLRFRNPLTICKGNIRIKGLETWHLGPIMLAVIINWYYYHQHYH